MPVLDLSTLFENEEQAKELYEALQAFFSIEKVTYNEKGEVTSRIIDTDGKTQLNPKEVMNITALEVMLANFDKHFDYKPISLVTLIERLKVNKISEKRQGRTEFVDILKGLFNREAEQEKHAGRGDSINQLLGRS